jgi:hypothetical protein
MAVGLFTLWIAWPFVAPGGYVTDYDTVTYSGPNLVATFRAWDEHRLPLWEPGIFGGTAFAGNLQTAVFYPVKLLFWPLGAPAAMGWMTATHLFVLALGMWWIARRTLRLVPPAGLVAAVVMVGSGTTMVRSVRFEQLSVVAWIPWLLVALDAVVAAPPGRRRRPIAAGAGATALVLLSGHPNQAMIGGALALLWIVVRVRDHQPPDGTGAAVARLAAAGGLGLGIAALPIVLAVPLLRHMAVPASVMLEEAGQDRYTLSPIRGLSALLGDAVTTGPAVEWPTLELPVFVGAAALVLAAFGAVVWCRGPDRPNRATGWGLVAGAGAGIVIALGPAFGVYRLAATIIPGFGNGRVPVRWLFVTTVAVALLAAAGVSELATRGLGEDDDRRPRLGALVGVVALTAVVALAPPWAGPIDASLGARSGWLVAAGLAATAVVRAGNEPASRRLGAVLAAAVIVIELALPARASYARTLRAEESFADRVTAVDRFLATQGARALVLGRSDVNANLTAGWRTLDGYDGGLWLSEGYVHMAERLSDGSFWVMERLGEHVSTPLDADELAAMGVRYAVFDPGTTDTPRHEMIVGWSGPVVTDGSREVWENPRYGGEARFIGPAARPETPPTVNRPEPTVIEVATAEDAGGGRLAVAEQALPGWAVTIDGEPAPVADVDGYVLAADVPPGVHAVRFRYVPPGFAAGAVISSGCLAITLALGLFGQRPIRRDTSSSSGSTGRSGTNTT